MKASSFHLGTVFDADGEGGVVAARLGVRILGVGAGDLAVLDLDDLDFDPVFVGVLLLEARDGGLGGFFGRLLGWRDFFRGLPPSTTGGVDSAVAAGPSPGSTLVVGVKEHAPKSKAAPAVRPMTVVRITVVRISTAVLVGRGISVVLILGSDRRSASRASASMHTLSELYSESKRTL